jgi:hypothetical protein
LAETPFPCFDFIEAIDRNFAKLGTATWQRLDMVVYCIWRFRYPPYLKPDHFVYFFELSIPASDAKRLKPSVDVSNLTGWLVYQLR